MAEIKLTCKRLHLEYEFPVQVGELKATLIAMVMVSQQDDGTKIYDCDFMDTNDISYMGVAIDSYEDWRKFKVFHNNMGIDFDVALDKEFAKVMTKAKLDKLVKDVKF